MASQLLNLPINIPWKLIAVSPDMMDTQFCNKSFPFSWRSSLAIFAYEPKIEDLPEEICDERITYLKVTCNITGYQPTQEETEEGYAAFPNVPTEELDRVFEEYFACYGALLNVAVFPFPKHKSVLKRKNIDFSEHDPETTLSNPFETENVSFQLSDKPANRIVDLLGNGKGELDLDLELVVILPSTPKVEVTVILAPFIPEGPQASVIMTAFKGDESIETQTTNSGQDQIHKLSIEGDGIDRVVFNAPLNGASLLEFSYYTSELEPIGIKDYPHIIAIEPKRRDLYQSATESGEILTASESTIKTDKSHTQTDSTETGYKLGSKVSFPIGGSGATGEVSGDMSHKRTETDQDTWKVGTEASRERREKEATSTQLSQMYNLLTSYHVGTNRTVSLLLARPHMLQPTDHRTFIQGLRFIEGIQEFFLIVTRPSDISGLSVEAFLETGHFPEGVEIVEPPVEFDESHEDFTVKAFADNSTISQNCSNIESDPSAVYTIASGSVIDRREKRKRPPGGAPGSGWDTDPDRPGIAEIANNSNDQANESLDRYDYRTIPDASAQVSGRICGERAQGDKARFNRTYRIFTRSEKPKPSTSEPSVPVKDLLITSRGLCASIRSGEQCVEIVPPLQIPVGVLTDSVVDETSISINPALLTRDVSEQTRVPAMREFLRKFQVLLSTSWRQRRRRPLGDVNFLDSDYFKDKIKDTLPEIPLKWPLTEVRDLPIEVIDALGKECTVAEALELDLTTFRSKTGLSYKEAVKARRKLLRISPQ